jgi:arabinose-5-phosphate isomerase
MNNIIISAIKTIEIESEAISELANQLTDDYVKAVQTIFRCTGKVIVTGMGKSGLIGMKIAATLASTGTPSFFLHPGEAYHGDLGMISKDDVILTISNSGQTDEILKLIPFLEENGNIIISMTGNPDSTLAHHSHIHLNIAVKEEACPLNLAPTTSTTAAIVMGDALAISIMQERNFKAEDFARYHPGGNLGYKLLTKVKDIMRKDNLPTVQPSTTIGEMIFVISKARMGLAVVIEEGLIKGIVTDGDIRRQMEQDSANFINNSAEYVMTSHPKVISPEASISEASQKMHQYNIHSLLVTYDNNILIGIIDINDIATI